MNIIGGVYRGRKIAMPRGVKIRPTSNKVREALFNILGNKVVDSVCLDLFAGSGSLGLEALSRGAAKCVFVDNNAKCVNTIRENLKKLGISDKAKIMQLIVAQAVTKLSGKEKFDLIFIDPPYLKDWVKKVLINIGGYDILKYSCIIVYEHHKKEFPPEILGGLVRFKQSKYGDTVLSFYRKETQ